MKTTKEQHTPGPWIKTPHEVHAGDGCEFHVTYGNTELGQANARIIAAAPELLEALEGLRFAYCNKNCPPCGYPHGVHIKVCEESTAAIAKARGES